MRRSLTIALSLAAGAGACGSEQSAESFTVTDSAGVTIATSSAPAWPEGGGWRLGGQPRVLIGGGVTDTSAIVGPIAGAMRLPDGRILVADAGATRLRWFSDDGTVLHSAGRQGEGPGEMGRIETLLRVGDSIAVFDGLTAQISVLDLEGRFGRRFRPELPEGAFFAPEPIGRLASNEWISVLDRSGLPQMEPGFRRDSVTIWISRADGAVDRRVADIEGGESGTVMGSGLIAPLRPLFAHVTTIRFHDGALWAGTGDEFRVDRLGLDGNIIRSVRLDQPPAPITPVELEAARDSARTVIQEYREPEVFLRALDEAPVPSVRPAYQSFQFDDAGDLWIQRYGRDAALATIWAVIDTAGRWLGDMTLPPGFDPTHISADEILGIWTDPDGLERVVAYPLLRDAATGN